MNTENLKKAIKDVGVELKILSEDEWDNWKEKNKDNKFVRLFKEAKSIFTD